MEADCYLQFALADLIIQPEETRQALLEACHRHAPARLRTLCQIEDSFLVVLQHLPREEAHRATREVQVDFLADARKETLLAKLQERWNAGYDPLGSLADSPQDAAPRRFLITQR